MYGDYVKEFAPGLARVLEALLPLIRAIGDSEPISPDRAAAAAAVVPAVMASSTLVDMRLVAELSKRRGVTGVVTSRAGARQLVRAPVVSAKELAEFNRLAGDLQGKLRAAADAGADLPLSLTEWRPDRPSWLDLIRRAVDKYREYEDQIGAAGKVKELIEEFMQTDEFARLP